MNTKFKEGDIVRRDEIKPTGPYIILEYGVCQSSFKVTTMAQAVLNPLRKIVKIGDAYGGRLDVSFIIFNSLYIPTVCMDFEMERLQKHFKIYQMKKVLEK